MVIKEIWRVSGFRFTSVNRFSIACLLTYALSSVHDHIKLEHGHKTRLWCSQDEARKKKSKASDDPNVKNRDVVGMTRYACKSSLTVTCKAIGAENEVSISLKHDSLKHTHKPYYDVALPPEAAQIIRDNVEFSTPNELARRILPEFPHVSDKQIHAAWTAMSEVLWKREPAQLPSAKALMEEFKDDVDIFDTKPADGVEQLCWGMKWIAGKLRGKVVEIALDATCTSQYF